MKLLKPKSCQWELGGGNVKALTALGDAFADISSDRGSTPLASTNGKRVTFDFEGRAPFIFAVKISLCTSQDAPSSAGLTCDCEANGIRFCGT
jgi:hypothetical protein